MNRLVLVLSAIAVLSGCAPKCMTNDEIIIEKNKCLAADMDYSVWYNLWYNIPVRVTCERRIVKQ